MNSKIKPYIGITGYKTAAEVTSGLLLADWLGLSNKNEYTFMMGFLTSDKRMINPSTAGKQSPARDSLSSLLEIAAVGDIMPTLHYYSEDQDNLGKNLITLFDGLYDKNLSRAVQLNMKWPSIDGIKQAKDKMPDLDIILQLPKRAMDMSEDNIAQKVSDYAGLVSYVLIDPSGGLGIDYDESSVLSLLKKLDDVLPSIPKGVAGGLGPLNAYERLSSLASKYDGSLICDAQGKLRSSNKFSLETEKSKLYALGAITALRGY